MKIQKLCVFLLVVVSLVASLVQSQSVTRFGKEKSETKFSMLQLCYKLWQSSDFGLDKKVTERAAWVIRDPNRKYRWLDYPKHRPSKWTGPLPEGMIAQIHTHSAFTSSEPSKEDIRMANEINAPVYTISAFGIWRVSPGGEVTKEANEDWYVLIEKAIERAAHR